MAVTICKAAGAGTILVADVSPRRLELARSLGADVTFDSRAEGWSQEARVKTHNQGPEVLLEMSGHPSAIRQGFAALRNGGTAALLGLPSEPVALDYPMTLSSGSNRAGHQYRKCSRRGTGLKTALRRLNLDPIITHTCR
jgi:threonine 3-dehydrogenase